MEESTAKMSFYMQKPCLFISLFFVGSLHANEAVFVSDGDLKRSPICSALLSTVAPAQQIRVGILFRTDKQMAFLAVGDAVSEHLELLRAMLQPQVAVQIGELREILWAGEILLQAHHSQPSRIKMVNNTSGSVFNLIRLKQSHSQDEKNEILKSFSRPNQNVLQTALERLEVVEMNNHHFETLVSQSMPDLFDGNSHFFEFHEQPHLNDGIESSHSNGLNGSQRGYRGHDLMNALFIFRSISVIMRRSDQSLDLDHSQWSDVLEKIYWLIHLYLNRGIDFQSFRILQQLIPEWLHDKTIKNGNAMSFQELTLLINDAFSQLAHRIERDSTRVEFYRLDDLNMKNKYEPN